MSTHHQVLLQSLAVLSGILSWPLVASACTTKEPRPECAYIYENSGVEPQQGEYIVYGTTNPDLAALDQAPVVVEGDLVTLTWTEAEVEHQIVWQIESYVWVDW